VFIGFQVIYFWISAFQLTALLDWRDGGTADLVTYGIVGVAFVIGYFLGGALFSRETIFGDWVAFEFCSQVFLLCAAVNLNRTK
jgi:hypothetical protein